MNDSYNPAYSTNFRLEFTDRPLLNYFIQTAQLPGISASGAMANHKGNNIYMQADQIEYDPLQITFLIDERFDNYLFLYDWMKRDKEKERPPIWLKDATLHILTANKTPNLKIRYHGMFCQMLGEVDFESSVSDPNALMCSATFRYQYFDIERTPVL